jgi:hypothetical protein
LIFIYYLENSNPNIIEIINIKLMSKINKSKIAFEILSLNENAIEILEENNDKINWNNLSLNPSIFELDYEQMRNNNKDIYEELIKEVMKPSKVFKEPEYDYLEIKKMIFCLY